MESHPPIVVVAIVKRSFGQPRISSPTLLFTFIVVMSIFFSYLYDGEPCMCVLNRDDMSGIHMYYICGSERGVMVIVVGNGHSDTSSNSG